MKIYILFLRVITGMLIVAFVSVIEIAYSQTNPVVHYSIPPQLNDGLQTASLSDVGIDSAKIVELTNEMLNGKYNIHSILILRNSKLVYENYFTGSDEIFGNPIGSVRHDRDSLHDCRSVTKSVVSACIGIALAQGKIKSVDQPVFDFFPEYMKYDTGMKRMITVRDLLTMTAGLQWNENVPYSDTTNSEIQMLFRKDPVDFVLSRTCVAKPGTVWNYSAGCTQLLATIIQRMTGEKIDSFAAENIFVPLGITRYHWYERADSVPWAPSGLRLRSRDMAKFGLLYLNNGRWYNQQILPADWVHQSMEWRINSRDSLHGYGYQFWCANPIVQKHPTNAAIAIGWGGQRIVLNTSLNLEVVVTAGYYNQFTDTPDDVISKYIAPAIKPETINVK